MKRKREQENDSNAYRRCLRWEIEPGQLAPGEVAINPAFTLREARHLAQSILPSVGYEIRELRTIERPYRIDEPEYREGQLALHRTRWFIVVKAAP